MILLIGELDAIHTCVGGTGRTLLWLCRTFRQCFELLTSLYWFFERVTPGFEESKTTAHRVVYGGPARWQDRFRPKHGFLLKVARMSASFPCSVPNILNCWVEHRVVANLGNSSFASYQEKCVYQTKISSSLCLFEASSHERSRNLRLCVNLIHLHILHPFRDFKCFKRKLWNKKPLAEFLHSYQDASHVAELKAWIKM